MTLPIRLAALASRRRPDRLTLLIAAVAAMGFGVVMARQVAYGPALSWDSLVYMSAARNLLAGDGLTLYNGAPLIAFPPLYPLALAATGLGRFDLIAVAGPLNAAVFGLTIFVTGQYLRRRLHSRFLTVWGCMVVALSVPLADLSAWALAGPLFILMTTLALIQTDKFLDEGKTSSLVWAAVFCALAWQTRYIGVAAPVAVGLLLLLQRGVTLPQKAGRIALFSLIAAVPMALWLWRGYLFAEWTITGETGVAWPLPDILRDIAGVLGGWTYLEPMWVRWPSLALLLLAVATLIIGGYFVIIKQRQNIFSSGCRPGYIFGAFAVTYLILLIAAIQQGSTWDGVQTRYIAPLYIPILMAASVLMDKFLMYQHNKKRPRIFYGLPVIRILVRGKAATAGLITVVLVATLSLWAAAQVSANVVQILRANSGDLYLGYSGPRWTDSETMRYIRENPISGIIYSNESPLLFMRNAGDASYPRLYKSRRGENLDYEGPILPGAGQEQLEAYLANIPDGAYVVWFSNWHNIHSYDFGEANFRVTPGLEPVTELPDGVIYRVNRDYTPADNPYLAAYQAIASGDYGAPVARDGFDLYLNDGSMIYLKEPCYLEDTRKLFSFHLIPADANDLPAHRSHLASDSLGFSFPQHGVLFDELCLAIVPLPGYEIARFSTGQYVREQGQLWLVEQDYVPPASPYQAAYDAIVSGGYGEPAARAAFDVYRNGNELIYLKEPCVAADTEALFFLHLYPAAAADLPAQWREYGFDARDFPFPQHGVRWGGKCLAIAPLPGYEIARIRTGQYIVGGEQIWKAEQYIIGGNPVWRVQQDDLPPASPYQSTYDAIVSGGYGEPEARAIFNIYRNGSELIYLKEPCAAADTEALFFLHLYPADAADLPRQHQEYGFDALDFPFPQYGARWSGRCLAIVPLPGYDIARIRTGQYIVGEEQIWKAEQYIIGGRPVWRVQQDDLPPANPYRLAYDAIAAGDYGEAAAGGVFDVYRHGGELIYLKEPCVAADTEARFYLHLFPAAAGDLPAERREYGFDNPDFQFPQYGVRWGGRCLALVPLPGYEIVRIRTGQYIVGGEAIWQADLR